MSDEKLDLSSDFVELLHALQEAPEKLAKLIDGLSDSDLRWRNSESEFSAIENICHLRDIEAEGYATRIKRILEEANPFLTDIDGGRLAFERKYNQHDAHLALRDFAKARTQNLQRLSDVTAEQLEREGTLEGVGKLTLSRLIEMMREHDEGHIEDLRVLRQRLKATKSI